MGSRLLFNVAPALMRRENAGADDAADAGGSQGDGQEDEIQSAA